MFTRLLQVSVANKIIIVTEFLQSFCFFLGQMCISLELTRELKLKAIECTPRWKFCRSGIRLSENESG